MPDRKLEGSSQHRINNGCNINDYDLANFGNDLRVGSSNFGTGTVVGLGYDRGDRAVVVFKTGIGGSASNGSRLNAHRCLQYQALR